MKDNKQRVAVLLHHRPRHLPGSEVRGGRRARQAYYRDKGYIAARVGAARDQDPGGLEGRQDALRRAAHPVQRGRSVRGRQLRLRGQQGRQDRRPSPAVQAEGRATTTARSRSGRAWSRRASCTAPGGYWEFTGYPGSEAARHRRARCAAGGERPGGPIEDAKERPPIVDVTMRMQEGEQYFVNRITLPRQHDDARQRHPPRDPAARKRRLQHRGAQVQRQAHQPARILQADRGGNDVIKVEKTPGEKNKVDVTLKFEEQNRNQLTFGAGVSQFEGFFGQLAFQTSNFLGRGESATFSVLAGARAKNYQLAFTEPFLFDRPITAGIDVFKREIRYYYSYTQASTGGNCVVGLPGRPTSRACSSATACSSRA